MDLVIKQQYGNLFAKYGWWKRKAMLGFFIGTFAYVYTGNFKHQCINSGNPAGITNFSKIRLCWCIFGRQRSRWFGNLMETQVPPTLRLSVFSMFSKIMGIDLREARYPIQSYKSIAHVFARTLKDGARPIERPYDTESLVVPCDGEIVNLAEIDFNDERVTQLNSNLTSTTEIGPVKGATFRIESFVGFDPRFNCGHSGQSATGTETKRRFAYAVIYLAPHNYHHFHSPCEMSIQMRRHMPGLVLPVFKGLASRLNDLFSVNERVVLSGRWKYGQLHYSAVAAYNVGNIRLKYEPQFRSNVLRTELYMNKRVMSSQSYEEPDFDLDFVKPSQKILGPDSDRQRVNGLWVEKGERLGEFRMGSTIVVILEIPSNFKWDVRIGDQVRMGQLLGHVSDQ